MNDDSVTPISDDGWTWIGAIDQKNISRNTIQGSGGVGEFKPNLPSLLTRP